MHLFVRFSQFQNYHTNVKRLDITLTKFIKLHDCIPVSFRFAAYTQNFLSLNGISWYKTNYYTEDPFRTHSRVSMGLTDRRKTAKNLADNRKN